MIEAELLQVFPTVGIGWEPHPQVRLGAAFGWGITSVHFSNAAFSRVEALGGVVEATADARNELEARDGFVPRLQLGIWAQPARDVPLELGASFQWTGTVDAHKGDLNVRAFNAQPLDVEAETDVAGVGLEVPQPAQLAFGARYAQKLDEPVDEIGDRLSTEHFDVEADLVLTFGKRVDSFDVNLPDGQTLVVDPGVPLVDPIDVELPEEIELERRWKTQLGLRIGGDYNPIPGVLGLRAGLSFESDGVEDGYEQIDFTPFRRVGLHFGGTVRIASRVDVSLAYAHIFQADQTVGVEEAQVRRVVSGNAADPNDPADAALVNAGRITGDSDVIIGEITGHF